MTPGEVRERLTGIATMAKNDAVAHEMEDKLRADVLVAIAAGAEQPGLLAALAMQTDAIAFCRWYA